MCRGFNLRGAHAACCTLQAASCSCVIGRSGLSQGRLSLVPPPPPPTQGPPRDHHHTPVEAALESQSYPGFRDGKKRCKGYCGQGRATWGGGLACRQWRAWRSMTSEPPAAHSARIGVACSRCGSPFLSFPLIWGKKEKSGNSETPGSGVPPRRMLDP